MNKRHRPEHGTTAIGRLDLRSRRVRTILALGVMALYALLFFPLYPLLGVMTAVLAIPPVAAAGWLLGMPAGVLAGLLTFPLHVLLLSVLGEPGWEIMTGPVLASYLVLVAIGAIVGRLRDLGEGMKEELTERKRAEKELRREMELNNILIQSSPAFFVAIGSDGKTMMMNDAMLNTLGYTMDEVAGRDYLTTFVPEGDRTMLSLVFEKLTKSNESTQNENRVLTCDGRELLLEWHGRAVFTQNGEFDFFFGLGIDITDRKRTEEILRKRTEQVIRHQTALLELSTMDYSDLNSALKKITEMDAKTLGVERVSVWLFTEDHSEIICEDLYKLSENLHEKGLSLHAKNHPRYFQAMKSHRAVAANDACTDPRTSEFSDDGYLKAYGITSMMDVPVRLHGEIVATVDHEHVGPRREWTQEEQDFAASIADAVSLTLEKSARKRAEEELQKRLKELEIYYRATMGRESRIIELKHQVNGLLEQLGKKKKYNVR